MKINKSNEVDILVKTPVKLEPEKPIIYSIKNNSKKTYIIDPYGFVGDSYWMLNNQKLIPIQFSRGYYSRYTDDECKNDLIILKPKQVMDTAIVLNYTERGIYNYSESGNYIRSIKSEHNKQNVTRLGCTSYIRTLEMQGYKVLEDSIVAKIPFYK